MDNVSRETGLVAPPIQPRTKLTPTPQPSFEDPKAILEHTNLHKAVQAASCRTQHNQLHVIVIINRVILSKVHKV